MHNLFIISTGRAASTSVYNFLNEFYDLNLPDNKEPHFFLDLHKFKKKPEILNYLSVYELSSYNKLYSKSKIIVDASVGYFFYVDEFIKKFKSLKKDQKFKIIFLYRNPVQKAKSQFIKQFIVGYEKKTDYFEAFSREMDKDSNIWWQYFYNNVEYYKNFLKIRENFDEVLAVNYDSLDIFIQNKELVLKKFLNIDIKEKKHFPKLNAGKMNNDLRFRNFVNFIRKKNKLNNIITLFKNIKKNLQLKILEKRINNKSLDFKFKKSIDEYDKLNDYLKKYEFLKGIYIVK